ncbi:DUF1366 domain-containing protein [Gemella morbillorum]
MAFKVYFKRDLNGEMLVVINDNNGTNIQRIIKGEHTDTDDETLVKLVLEQFYQEVYPNRAENERFAKLDKITKEQNELNIFLRKALGESAMKEFEYDELFKDISCKFEFLANHLKVELPTTNEKEEENGNEQTEGGSK